MDFSCFGIVTVNTRGQEWPPARDYGRPISSARRSRAHPVLLQKIYEGAHLRQEQAVAQGEDAQCRGWPLKRFEHYLEPSVGEMIRNLPGWHSDESGTCQRCTDQRIEIIGAKPGWNASDSDEWSSLVVFLQGARPARRPSLGKCRSRRRAELPPFRQCDDRCAWNCIAPSPAF